MMKVDGLRIEHPNIEKVIDKLAEADGSFESRLEYLCDAAQLLACAIAEIATEEADARNEAERENNNEN